jgi:dTDP-4-dehydrorhamnose 3,5-epimerase
MFKIKKTELDGVLSIEPCKFIDRRGTFVETYNKKFFNKKIKNIKFLQDDISVSKKNVLRGIHGDNKTWKLISCLFGKIYFVVLNNDNKSNQYGKWESFIISDNNYKQILVPPKFGNGYLVLSNKAIFSYKQSTYYNRGSQFTISWKDSRFKIKWPTKNPILSKRDNF